MLIEVERKWKSDGQINIMTIQRAVENILHNTTFEGDSLPSRDFIQRRLLAGEVFETPLAEFRIKK